MILALTLMCCRGVLGFQPEADRYKGVAKFEAKNLIGLDSPAEVRVEVGQEGEPQDRLARHAPLRPARVCIRPVGEMPVRTSCYHPASIKSWIFFFEPRGEVIDLSSTGERRNAIFFEASACYGGSGCAVSRSLVVFSPQERALRNLLPPVIWTNQSEH